MATVTGTAVATITRELRQAGRPKRARAIRKPSHLSISEWDEALELNKDNTGKFFWPLSGRREVWLPDFSLTLIRTSYLPANMACFQVPLNMNKLDMKDYMWSVYKVPVASVRSYIQVQKVVRNQAKSTDILPTRGSVYRPKSTKRMIIEMLNVGDHGGPFVWPEPVDDLSAWSKEAHVKLVEAEEKESQSVPKRTPKSKEEVKTLRDQAQELLSGKKVWKANVPYHVRMLKKE